MQKTYRVHLIGQKDPIYIDGFKGKILADDFANGKLKGRTVEIDGGVYSGSDVRSVAPGNRPPELNPSSATTGQNLHQEISDQYFAERKRILKLSPAERAKNIGIASVIYYVVSSKHLEENTVLRQKVEQVQTTFFTQFPNRIHPDPIIFKDLFRNETLNSKITVGTDAGIRAVELAISRDIHLAR